MIDRDECGTRGAFAAVFFLSAVGGAIDAWVYLMHGHVFASAQTGNVVLMMVDLSHGDWAAGGDHLPSLLAFIMAMFASQWVAEHLRQQRRNARAIRLWIECALLLGLAFATPRLGNHAITACVGFIAGWQITSLSRLYGWSFNTGVTTGNMRSAAHALFNWLRGSRDEWPHALLMVLTCCGFAMGALAGGWLVRVSGAATLLFAALLVASAALLAPGTPDLRADRAEPPPPG